MIVLIVPGYTGSGPLHWQTWLQNEYENIIRVEQSNWDQIDREIWIRSLDDYVRQVDDDVLLVGHSCGSVTIAQWAASRPVPSSVRGAILVAPTDVDSMLVPAPVFSQRPLPTTALAVSNIIVSSTNDPYLSQRRAAELAKTWGSQDLVWVSNAGHLASSDGFGRWPLIVQLIEAHAGPLIKKDNTA